MLPTFHLLRTLLKRVIEDKTRQGHVTAGLHERLSALPDSYDTLAAFAQELRVLPLRPDWQYHEPNDLLGILAACDPDRETGPLAPVDPVAIAPRIEAAFLTSVCGCILGKPLEISATGHQIRAAAEAVGEWPLTEYISEKLLKQIGNRHDDAGYTERSTITIAGADDDLNYTITGMLMLERHGEHFTIDQLSWFWMQNIPLLWQWGPERTVNMRAAMHTMAPWTKETIPYADWVEVCNPGDEACGALIRADAYGYACPGDPARAAALAWKDASYTHRRTGIYGTMFAAAAIAAAFVERDRLRIFEIAARQIPARSRFRSCVDECLVLVRSANDWWDGYSKVHERFKEYGHCGIYQEVGTMINTLRFAKDAGEGIGMQVAQGNDTDSFGCTCGSILGAYFGGIDQRWLKPFNDTIHTTIAGFHEQRLSAVAQRMGRLPALLSQQVRAET